MVERCDSFQALLNGLAQRGHNGVTAVFEKRVEACLKQGDQLTREIGIPVQGGDLCLPRRVETGLMAIGAQGPA